ncbi:DUF3226 domain-containing protein [Methylobacter tundripaludum]|uniref:DUF3226 domain-containing protein n=1 Tax=Methylobacter tundripaludum TaxID=173365 RepID=UPI0004DFB9DE|nr:DUF3226 domain-containing protein [Methylobacter tundripaludum]
MADSKKILLVEGDADKSFFQKICKNLSLNTSVQVAPPKDLGGRRNSKEGAIQQLELLLPQLNDGELTHIAVIVDADYRDQQGLGYQKTIDRIAAIVKSFDFELDQGAQSGICFKNTDGLADLGLWIMPNNQDEGMLEDWIKSCVNESEQALFQQATNAVKDISTRKFPDHSLSKAEVATWLAWQKQPGHGLYAAITDQLLDNEHPLFTELKQWLLNVFTKEVEH